MMGYGMGKNDWKEDRARRLAEKYPDRVASDVVEVIVADDAVFGFDSESVDVQPPPKKGGRPKGSKNKAKD